MDKFTSIADADMRDQHAASMNTDLFGNSLTPEAAENDYWYTPPKVLACVHDFLGEGYFDPCPVNPKDDGLQMAWQADCFINPPYSAILKRAFIDKAYAEYKHGSRFLWLLNFGNSKDLWDLHLSASAVCVPQTRIRFIPGHPALGDGSSPRYDNIFILWGDPAGFEESFASVGKVYLTPMNVRFKPCPSI